MKSLKNLNFGANELLQRNQMKSVLGGSILTEAGGCASECGEGSGNSCPSGFPRCEKFMCDSNGQSVEQYVCMPN